MSSYGGKLVSSTITLPGLDLTVYPEISELPVLVGGENVILVFLALITVATTLVGALGVPEDNVKTE
jgi:hypothetical protein